MKKKLFLLLSLLLVTAGWAGAEKFFPLVAVIDPVTSSDSWSVSGSNIGPQTAVRFLDSVTATKNGSLELTYHLTGADGLNYCEFKKTIYLPIGASQLRFWVHADGSGHTLRVRLRDKTGQYLQYTVGTINWLGWKQVSIDVTKPNSYWGGSGDGVVSQPLRLESILVDSKSRSFVGTGKILIDELSVVSLLPESQSVIVTVEGKRAGNIFTDDEPVAFTLKFENLTDISRQLEITWWASTTTGRNLYNGNLKAEVGGKKTAQSEIRLPLQAYGNFNLRLYLRSTDGVLRLQKDIAFSRLMAMDGRQAMDLGVCTHFAQDKGDVQKNLDLAKLSGARWIRDEIYWARIEQEKGKFVFPAHYDAYIREAAERNLSVLVILSYGNALYGSGAPTSEEQLAAWGRYVETVVSRYHETVKHWEVWNEFSHGAGLSDEQKALTKAEKAEIYLPILRIAYETIKRIDPEATVIGFANAGIDTEFIDEVLKRGGGAYMDAVSIHPYGYPQSPEDSQFISKLEQTRAMIDKHGKPMPIWITEIGWPTHTTGTGVTERLSGAYGVRMHILALESGLVDKIFWYDLQDDGTDPTYNEHNFGLLHHWKEIEVPWAAKDNYLAYVTMNRKLPGTTFIGSEALNRNIRLYRFKKANGEDLLVLWALRGSETVGLKSSAAQALCTDLFGNAFPLSFQDGIATLTITAEPIYLEGNLSDLTLAQPLVSWREEKSDIVSGEVTTLQLQLRRPLSDPGQLVPDLPNAIRLASPATFAEGEQNVAVSLFTDGTGDQDSYELVFYLAAGRKIIGRVTHHVQVIAPLNITVKPHYQAGKWYLAVGVENYSQTQTLSGTITLREPAAWATKPTTFSDVGPKQNRSFLVPVGEVDNYTINQITVALNFASGFETVLRRPVTFSAAKRARQIPTFTGNLKEWENQATPFFINKAEQVKKISNWGGPEDLSGTGYLLWDEENLYLAVAVIDDVHYQTETDDRLWNGDSIQFAVDPARQRGIGRDDYHELGYALGDDGQLLAWRWRGAYDKPIGKPNTTKALVTRKGNQTIYEIALPWTELLAEGTEVGPGTAIGFSLLINENDGNGRRGWIEYMSGIGQEKDPWLFGDVVLVD